MEQDIFDQTTAPSLLENKQSAQLNNAPSGAILEAKDRASGFDKDTKKYYKTSRVRVERIVYKLR